MYQYPSWLLETKLRPNKSPSNWIERGRINHMTGIDANVVLIHAPPGYGKTSAMCQLYEASIRSGRNAAWLSLDEHDQDPLRLFCYLVASLKSAGCDIDYVLPPQPQDLAKSSFSFLTDTLIKALSQSEKPYAIFLDDFHRAESNLSSRLVRQLLSGLTSSTIVLSARYRPSKIDAADLRATGRLTEISKDELRFSAADIEHYLGERLTVKNRQDYCQTMAKHSEGWPIALQAIRQLLAKGRSAQEALEQTTGRSSLLSAYFIEQVFETLSSDCQTLLLSTAMCDRINGDLADYICGTKNAWAILENLESSDTFIESLDADRQWYRYHRLFAEFLIERARRSSHIDIAQCAKRAALWHRENNDPIEAIQFALTTNDPVLVAETLAALGGWRQAMMGNLSWVLKALECLPSEVIRKHPSVWIADIYAKLKVGEYEAAANGHRDLRLAFSEALNADASLRKDVALVDSLIVVYSDQHTRLAEMVEHLESMDTALTENDHYFAAMQLNTLSFFHFRLGAFDTAHRYAEACILSYQKAGSLYGEAFVYFHQCFTYYLEGRLRDAKSVLHQGLDLSTSQFGFDSDLYAIGAAYASLLYYESNELAQARQYLDVALPKIERSDAWTEVYLAAYAAGFSIAQATGKSDTIAQIHTSALTLAQRRDLTRVGRFAQVLRGAHEEATSTIASGECLALDSAGDTHALTRFDVFHTVAARARQLIKVGKNAEALDLLSNHRAWARRTHLYRPFITLALLSAIASKNLGKVEDAKRFFNDALAPALFEEFKRPFIDEGREVVELIRCCAGYADQYGHNRLRDRFLAAVVAEINASNQARPSSQTLLSTREIDVVRSLVQGRTNQEISDVLGISRNTVKFHLKNVFEKLNVSSRQDAIRLCLRHSLM